MEKVTIKDVAKAADVSIATVSRALSGCGGVGETTRKRIVALCEKMGYTPNAVARSMVKHRTDTIGLIVSSISNPYMSEMTDAIETCLRERGYNLMVCNSSRDIKLERDTYELLISRMVDGILLIPAGSASYSSLLPLLGKVPTVFISEKLRDFPVNFVSVDNYRGGKLGTEYLVGLGHKKILYLGRRPESAAHCYRAKGYEDVCRVNGLEPEILDSTGGHSDECGYALAKAYFSKGKPKHTAFFCATDSIAIGVMRAADEMGVRIPEDISLIGFDNIHLGALSRISLTTVAQPIARMAASAVDMLLEDVNYGSRGDSYRVLAPNIVERTSCAPLPRAKK